MEKEHIKLFGPTNWAIKNKTAIYIFTVLISIVGYIIFQRIPKEQFPDIVDLQFLFPRFIREPVPKTLKISLPSHLKKRLNPFPESRKSPVIPFRISRW